MRESFETIKQALQSAKKCHHCDAERGPMQVRYNDKISACLHVESDTGWYFRVDKSFIGPPTYTAGLSLCPTCYAKHDEEMSAFIDDIFGDDESKGVGE